jgi:hypothetical protein
MRRPYPTDLSDAEWNYIQPHLPAPKGHGRPRTHSLREIQKHPRQVSLPQTYAQPMLRAGELCVPHSKSDERAARPSYASGGTQMPTLGGSKSSYSSRLCRPRFLRVLCAVSWETFSTMPSSTALSASNLKVQRFRPRGGSEQARAIRGASARPSKENACRADRA